MRLFVFFVSCCLVLQAGQEPWAGFYKKSVDERLQLVQDYGGVTSEQISSLKRSLVGREFLEKLRENVIGAYTLPLSMAPNFVINGKVYLVPMVTEEQTVVAAASLGAKLAGISGGFTASVTPPVALGQIVLIHVPDIEHVQKLIRNNVQNLTAQAQQFLSGMYARGGGLVALQARKIETARGAMLIVEVQVNTCDAMGANIVTRVAELLAPGLARLTGGTVLMGIVNNLAVSRIARARAIWPRAVLGDVCIERILDAYACACADMARGVTHNKGIMNGIDAVALATGNDFRALEAGAHGYAAREQFYQPLTHYYTNKQGDLGGGI